MSTPVVPRLRALRRLRHATILSMICGHAGTMALAWWATEGRGLAAVVPALGNVVAALLLPTFFLTLGRTADTLRDDGKRSLNPLEVWGACLVPLWSAFGIPILVARAGKIVAGSTDAPLLPRRMTVMAWLHGLTGLLGPGFAIVLFGGTLGVLVAACLGTFLFALSSHFLVQPLEDAVAALEVPALGGVGNEEPVAVRSV